MLSFVDTAGAYPGIDAEERGQAEAIARSTDCCLSLGVPTIAVVIGEGGSGGAIAIATANVVMMLEHAIYSVISPEGAASILWRDAARAKDAAAAMKITAQDLKKLDVIDEIVPEPKGGAHRAAADAIAATGAPSRARSRPSTASRATFSAPSAGRSSWASAAVSDCGLAGFAAILPQIATLMRAPPRFTLLCRGKMCREHHESQRTRRRACRHHAAWLHRLAAAAAPRLLTVSRRTLEVKGKAASVYGITGPDGKPGLDMLLGERFNVRLRNDTDTDTIVHWHGLTPPFGQDGVAMLGQDPDPPGSILRL